MTCERHGGNAGSIMCRECDLETIERDAMTTPNDLGHACSPTQDCTAHNLHCGYPECAKGRREGVHARPMTTPTPTGKERPIIFSGPMVKAIIEGRKSQTRRAMKPQIECITIKGDDGIVTYSGLALPKKGGGWTLWPNGRESVLEACPYGQPGDRLWVRESWRALNRFNGWPVESSSLVAYEADENAGDFLPVPQGRMGMIRPSIHMPRWASRLTLEVTGVRVERLNEISEADAVAEGVEAQPFPGPWWQGYRDMGDGELLHQQHVGESPPDWMIEPKRMKGTKHLDRSAVDMYRGLWDSINGAGSWAANPWVWVIEFKRVED